MSSSSSSGAKPSSSSRPSSSSSSSAAKPSSSSSAANQSSSSSSAKPSSSSSGSTSSSSSSKPAAPTQLTPYISANAWMSFFLFVCLVIIILQGPLGLAPPATLPTFGIPNVGFGGGIDCAGVVAAASHPSARLSGSLCNWPLVTLLPWCVPVAAVPYTPLVAQVAPTVGYQAGAQGVIDNRAYHPTRPIYHPNPPGVGGHGYVVTPDGAGGYGWYANPLTAYAPPHRPPRPLNVQYQRPGLQVQVNNSPRQGTPNTFCSAVPHACTGPIIMAYAQDTGSDQIQMQTSGVIPDVPVPATAGPAAAIDPAPALVNLESAFYPLLVGAIALLVIFDYAS